MSEAVGCDAPAAVTYQEALRGFEQRAVPVEGTEMVPLAQAQGRVLAEGIVAPRDVPAFDNAAVDGVAFAWTSELVPGGWLDLRQGRSAAGHGFSGRVAPGEAVRILTGAPLPDGTDTLAPNELCSFEGERVRVPAGLVKGANRRFHGEDVVTGARLLNRGARLGPWQIAVAAALGRGAVLVFRRLRVALFSTGDELLAPGSEWHPTGVFDANRPLLATLLAGLPVVVDDHGILRDEPARIRSMIDKAGDYDLVVASGGASRGDEDHVAAQLAAQGALDFWTVAMRPGRPLALGALGRSVWVALPGNPVAAAVCFLRFVRPLVLARAGAGWCLPQGRLLPAGFHMAKKLGRVELLRCRLVEKDDGAALEPVIRQGSAMLSTLLEADGIAELDADRAAVAPGDSLSFLSWRDLGMD